MEEEAEELKELFSAGIKYFTPKLADLPSFLLLE